MKIELENLRAFIAENGSNIAFAGGGSSATTLPDGEYSALLKSPQLDVRKMTVGANAGKIGIYAGVTCEGKTYKIRVTEDFPTIAAALFQQQIPFSVKSISIEGRNWLTMGEMPAITEKAAPQPQPQFQQ